MILKSSPRKYSVLIKTIVSLHMSILARNAVLLNRMTKLSQILVSLLLIASPLFGQHRHVEVFVSNGVFKRDSTISEVLETWKSYLNSRPDSEYNNPFWNDAEKSRYMKFDLAKDIFSPNLYALMAGYKPTVMSITDEKPFYKIRTLFASADDSGFADPLAIEEVYAKREGRNFKLFNALPVNTREWSHKTIGSITYIFPPYHTFNDALAKKMSRFADSLSLITQIPSIPVDFYLADSYDELAKARGLDFQMGEGNVRLPSGHAEPDNRIIYGSGINEYYPHELVHVYFGPLYPKAHAYFSEGIATELGGSHGLSLKQLLRRGDSLLTQKPSIHFDSLLYRFDDQLDYITSATYLVGGLLCQMALDKGSWPLIRRLMKYDNSPESLFKAVDDTFGVKRQDYDLFIKQKISEYAKK